MINTIIKDKSLKGRIMSSFIAMGLLVFLVATIGFATTQRLAGGIDTLANNSLPSVIGLWKVNEGQTQIESSERALLLPSLTGQERQVEFERIKSAWEQIDQGFKQYETTPRSEEEDRNYKKLLDNWGKWKADHEEFVKLVHQLDDTKPANAEASPSKSTESIFSQLRDRAKSNRLSFEAATTTLVESIKINEKIAADATKAASHDVNQGRFWTVIAMIAGPILAVLLGRYLGAALIRRLQQSVVQITTSATQIAASGKQLEATVAEQLASTNEVTATAQNIASTSGSLVKTMEQVAGMAQSTANSANASQSELGKMEEVMRQLNEATTSIASKLGVMNTKANKINNVVVTITKVADQTSLLSLNAAIEAEKAGEYGAGFAVVAREIRRLANQTAVATLEIEQIVKDMQSAVTVGVMEMDKFNRSVTDSADRVNNISDQIAKVIQEVQDLPPRFERVSQNMEAQSESAYQISEAMNQLGQASHQTVDALRETNSALDQLDDAAKGLRREIAHAR
jgi:methyl-accepting chemotaxis protein WspA